MVIFQFIFYFELLKSLRLKFLPPSPLFLESFFSPNPRFKNSCILQVSEARANFEEFFLYFSSLMERFSPLKGTVKEK